MEELLRRALEEVYEHEFDKYEVKRRHFFSFRHRRMMRKLFKQLETKNKTTNTTQAYHYKPTKKHPSAIIIAIILSVMLSITAAAIAIYSFGFKKQPDHTIAFSENIENAPLTIDYRYVIDSLPDGFKEIESTDGTVVCGVKYQNDKSILSLKQWVKKKYICNYNTEGYEIEEIDVNGHDGFFITINNKMVLVWDNGDYVLELYGTLDKDELLNLSKYTKIQQIENLS